MAFQVALPVRNAILQYDELREKTKGLASRAAMLKYLTCCAR